MAVQSKKPMQPKPAAKDKAKPKPAPKPAKKGKSA